MREPLWWSLAARQGKTTTGALMGEVAVTSKEKPSSTLQVGSPIHPSGRACSKCRLPVRLLKILFACVHLLAGKGTH